MTHDEEFLRFLLCIQPYSTILVVTKKDRLEWVFFNLCCQQEASGTVSILEARVQFKMIFHIWHGGTLSFFFHFYCTCSLQQEGEFCLRKHTCRTVGKTSEDQMHKEQSVKN